METLFRSVCVRAIAMRVQVRDFVQSVTPEDIVRMVDITAALEPFIGLEKAKIQALDIVREEHFERRYNEIQSEAALAVAFGQKHAIV